MPTSRLIWRAVRDVFTIQQDLPAGGLLKPGNHAQRRGLTATAGAKKGYELALFNLKLEILHSSEFGELLTCVLDIQECHG